jgi:hypothetical protein
LAFAAIALVAAHVFGLSRLLQPAVWSTAVVIVAVVVVKLALAGLALQSRRRIK